MKRRLSSDLQHEAGSDVSVTHLQGQLWGFFSITKLIHFLPRCSIVETSTALEQVMSEAGDQHM